MYKVLVADPMSELGLRQLLLADDIEVDQSTGLSEEELVSIIASYDALLVRSQTRVTRRILEAAGRLKVVGRAGVGVDNIDLEAATRTYELEQQSTERRARTGEADGRA